VKGDSRRQTICLPAERLATLSVELALNAVMSL